VVGSLLVVGSLHLEGVGLRHLVEVGLHHPEEVGFHQTVVEDFLRTEAAGFHQTEEDCRWMEGFHQMAKCYPSCCYHRSYQENLRRRCRKGEQA
jgi:hypothetical protein